MPTLGLLSGRLAVVTGGGSGIGRAVCKALARDGARVAALDWNLAGAEETIQSLDFSGHQALQVDVSSAAEVNEAIQQVYSTQKIPPTIAVNSAGITRDNFLVKIDEESFDKVIDVNLKGTFFVTQAVVKLMIENMVESGSIINISSIIGKVGNMGQCNYAASKAGVIGITKSAAKELARNNIRCNAVLPGFIVTPLTETVPDKVMTKMKENIPAGRLGTPEEIAEVCSFLASDRSSYMTGSAIEVAGGLFM